MNKLISVFLLFNLWFGFSQVPDTSNFSFDDVCLEIGLTGSNRNLAQAFASARPGGFDTRYVLSGESLLEFRNYLHVAPVGSIDCELSAWSDWSSCSGQSTQTRTRTVITPATGGGQACGVLSETINCPPINCELSEWSVYSSCDGQSTQTRTRTVITPASNGGTSCGVLSETINCPLEPEPIVNCVLSEWSAYSSCSGQSTQTRTRTVITPASGGGVACGALSETINCPPVDCVLSDWSTYSSCSGQSTQTRTRTVLVPARNGGSCSGVLSETINCPVVAECLSYDIRNDEQEELTFYYYDCNNQYQPVTIDGLQNLLVCANQAPQITGGSGRIIQYGNCGDPIPEPEPEPIVNCVLSEWSAYSSCSGQSTQTRTRTVITPASGGGTTCGALTETISCPVVLDCTQYNLNITGDDYEYSYLPCSEQQERITVSGVGPIYIVGICAITGSFIIDATTTLESAGNCGDPQPEPVVDCVLSEWSEWSSCVNNIREKTRTVITPASGGGTACGPLTWSDDCSPVQECFTYEIQNNANSDLYFEYTDCSGALIETNLARFDQDVVCAQSAPTIIGGSGFISNALEPCNF